MKKFLSLLLVCCMLLGLGAVSAQADDTPEITWFLRGVGTTAPDDCLVLQEIQNRLGIKINTIQCAPGDDEAKLNSLIAGNKLPDVLQVNLADAQEFINEGALLPLDELLPKYGQHILAEVGDQLADMPANKIDGSIYMIMKNNQSYTDNLAIRVDWLKKLGLEMPTDLDSLFNVLHAFTYDDPDGNGVNDTVGIVFTMTQNMQWEPIFGAFGINYNGAVQLEDGTVTTWMKSPKYLDAINYLRKLYQDGSMDPTFATMPAMTAHESLWNGRCGAYGFQFTGTANNWYPGRYTFECPADPAEVFGYTVIEGPYGDKGTPKRYPSNTNGFVIPATSEHPEAAMKLIDFLFSEEGDELTYFGVEDVMFKWTDKENGKYERLPGYEDDASHRAAGGFTFWQQCLLNNAEIKTLNALTQEAQAFAVENAFDWPKINTVLEADTEYGSTLSDITKEALAQLIVTTGDVEAEYKAFVERWNEEGGLEWEKEATAAYKAEHAE